MTMFFGGTKRLGGMRMLFNARTSELPEAVSGELRGEIGVDNLKPQKVVRKIWCPVKNNSNAGEHLELFVAHFQGRLAYSISRA